MVLTDNSGQDGDTTWFGDEPKPIFTADSGKIHLGFDPPNYDGEDSENEPYYTSLVHGRATAPSTTLVSQSINHINLVSHSTNQASDLKLWYKDGNNQHVGSSPFVSLNKMDNFSLLSEDIIISSLAPNHATNETITIDVVSKSTGAILQSMKVFLFVEQNIKLRFYAIEDSNSLTTQYSSSHPAPQIPALLSLLNDTYRQVGVSFTSTLDTVSEQSFNYDTKALLPNNLGFDNNSPDRDDPDGEFSEAEAIAMATQVAGLNTWDTYFPHPSSGLRIIFARKSGRLYDSNDPVFKVRGWAVPLICTETTGNFVGLAVAHEIGHHLFVHVAELNLESGGHDTIYPSVVTRDNSYNVAPGAAPTLPPHKSSPEYVVMAEGEPQTINGNKKLPWLYGRWMAHEQWTTGNTEADATNN